MRCSSASDSTGRSDGSFPDLGGAFSTALFCAKSRPVWGGFENGQFRGGMLLDLYPIARVYFLGVSGDNDSSGALFYVEDNRLADDLP